MAGRSFLRPSVKVVICVIGMIVVGYFLYPSVARGDFDDKMTIARVIVFVGFGFFLFRNLAALAKGDASRPADDDSES